MLHNEGQTTRNYTAYNFEVLRDDIYMLGVDGTVTKHRIAPTRSTCAVVVSSQNANRDWLYYMQQTISAEGLQRLRLQPVLSAHRARHAKPRRAPIATSRAQGDNNAWMAQLLMQGTNLVNFMGRYVYVAEGSKGFDAVTVAEHDDPPAVFGSDLQKIVYPEDYAKHREAPARTRTKPTTMPGMFWTSSCAANICTRRMGKGGFPRLRCRQHRQQEISRRR